MQLRFWLLIVLVFTLLLAAPAAPQSTTYGQLVGIVRDAQGLVLPGVSVALFGPASVGEPTLVTEVDGSYLFRALPPGTYDLRFELSGFATFARQGIIITTGTTLPREPRSPST